LARSPVLALYRAATARGEGWAERRLARRLAEGKEDADRLDERRGHASRPRPPGRVIWFHAASVGESLSLLEVIRRLLDTEPDLSCLITTGTVTSAQVLAARAPDRCLHQFAPLDLRPHLRRFLGHWRPDLAIWAESELWPNMIEETAATGCPMLMLNARLSERSAGRWRFANGAARHLLGRFRAVQAQDRATARALIRLGLPEQRLTVTGTLKEGTPPPPCDPAELARLTRLIGTRPVWLAASTHPGEEAQVLAAHQQASRHWHRLLLILAPRHPDRGDEIAAQVGAERLHFVRRSTGPDPDGETRVWLADTLGEMGLWYRLAPVSFVGGSLVPVGGHNPYEPAALGSAILHGPHVANFADIYARLDAAGGARAVMSGAELAMGLGDALQPDVSAPMAYAAWDVCATDTGATDRAVALIAAHLPAATVPA